MKYLGHLFLSITIFLSNSTSAQESARIIEAFSNRCPLTAGGTSNPLNQAMADITSSGQMLTNIETDRAGGHRCAGAVQNAQLQFNSLNAGPIGGPLATSSDTSGGSTGVVSGGDGKGGPATGGAQPSTGAGVGLGTTTGATGLPITGGSTPRGPISSEESYTAAFNNLLQEGQIAEYERQIAQLNAELENSATAPARQIQIQNEIAHLQAQINSIQIELRVSSERSRLTVYRHVSTASNALLSAIQSCQDFPDIIAQLTPAAINIGSSLGAIGGASVLALDAISGLIGGVVAFFRDRDVRDARADLERAYAPTAVRCAYMTMGEQYCHTLDLRRSFLVTSADPRDLVRRDEIGRCELTGFDLLERNIRGGGGLTSSIGQISHVLNQAVAGPGAMSELDRLVFGSSGGEGFYNRLQQIDNYYGYVNRSLRNDLSNLLARRSETTDPVQRTNIETAARRLTNMIRDVDNNIAPTRQLMQSLQDYRENVYDNFDPSANTSAYVNELNTQLMSFMTAEGGAQNFETSLQRMVDMHREALALRWSDELEHLTPTTAGMNRTEIIQGRTRLRRRMQALTSLGQEEVARMASIGVAELAAVSIDHRRETVSSATETQRQNLLIMGRYLRPHLESNIQAVAREYSLANPSDASRGAIHDRLRGLCESTLMLNYDQVTDGMRGQCGTIIYRNEGSSNVTFNDMYRRMQRGAPFSSEVACHQFNQPDNVSRDP